MVPLKNERQTGLLSPEFGFIENRKFVFSQSLFWAIDRSRDMTFTLKTYELGGIKEMAEYRYMSSEADYGEMSVSHIADSVFRSSSRYNYFRAPEHRNKTFNRWAFKSYQQLETQSNLKARLNVNLVSDLQYPKDFFDEFKTYSDSGLENSLHLSKPTENYLMDVHGTYFRHLIEANPLANNSAAVHKLPELKVEAPLQRLGQSFFYYKWGFTGSSFVRNSKYDDISIASDGQKYVTNKGDKPSCDKLINTESPTYSEECELKQDGIYDEGRDLIRTGERLQFKSALTTQAITLGSAINVTPQVSYSHTNYFFPVGTERQHQRQVAQFDVLSRSKLYRIFDSADEKGLVINKFKHEFIPELSYAYIPWTKQDSHPFFGTSPTAVSVVSDADLNLKNNYGLQFDYEDRIYERHLVTLTLLNRVIRKKMSDQSYKGVFDFRLAQSYDLYQASSGANQGKPLSDLTGTTNFYLDEFTLSNQFNYNPYLFATNSSTTLTYRNPRQQYFKVGYNSKRIEEPTKDNVSLALGFVSKYLNLLAGVVIDTSANVNSSSRLEKQSLVAQLKPPGECWAINFYRSQKVGSDIEWKVRFDFSFDGKPTKVIPPDELNIN
jgi:LPS-assembly protein